ncbi:hypothetical protein [Amnibacterium endophyticum]|uniref:Uncharacterized protein n=1 Tax=Amnibacterium endophyticum TaxID=2109337 RepID=A0ABW4LF82_9MICO
MKTREFDPVRSAALRNELESLPTARSAPSVAERLCRPQVWVTAVTAILLLAATVGVLQVTAAHEPQPARTGGLDALQQVTDPDSGAFVARAVHVLLQARGEGLGERRFEVPSGTGSVRVLLVCASDEHFTIDLSGGGGAPASGASTLSGGCGRTIGGTGDVPVEAGAHRVAVHTPADVRWDLLVIRTPDPTVRTGPVIDPLAAVRDPYDPDSLPGDTRPLLQGSGRGSDRVSGPTAPAGVRLRAYLVCSPSSSSTTATIDGHRVRGCMNSIAHWFDFTPTDGRLVADVRASGDWALLVVRAPAGAAGDSPDATVLPYPAEQHDVLARTRGSGASASGTYVRRSAWLTLVMTCRGSGSLEVETPDGGTRLRGRCDGHPIETSFGGEDDGIGRTRTWTAVPHGDISWTFQILDGS